MYLDDCQYSEALKPSLACPCKIRPNGTVHTLYSAGNALGVGQFTTEVCDEGCAL